MRHRRNIEKDFKLDLAWRFCQDVCEFYCRVNFLKLPCIARFIVVMMNALMKHRRNIEGGLQVDLALKV